MLYADLFLYGIKRVVAGLLLIACLTGMMREETVVDFFLCFADRASQYIYLSN